MTHRRFSKPARRPLPSAAHAQPAPAGDPALVRLVYAARAGDPAAVRALVCRFEPRMRAIARSYRLNAADVDDVVQSTWLCLLEDIDRVREPAAIAGWLATVASRCALRVAQGRAREQPSDDVVRGERDDADGPEAVILAAERREALAHALTKLPERHRQVMTVLVTQPGLDYSAVSCLLDVPRGSLGPIRARCLSRLRRDPRLRALCDESAVARGVPAAPVARRPPAGAADG